MKNNNPHVYEFKYEGKFTGLDALTVLHSQINFVSAIKEIKDHKFPEIQLDFKINGLEKGSLDINHVIEVAAVSGMFVMENVEYIENVFKIFGDIIKLKKFLKEKKADEVKSLRGDTIEIHLNGDNIQIASDAFKIYQNSQIISGTLTNTGRLLNGDKEIEFVQISEKKTKKKLIKIEKEDFSNLGSENPYLSTKTDEQFILKQILFIKKPNLFPERNKKWIWEFIHQGRDIKAPVIDENFKGKINNGLKLGQGDRLKADLKVFYKFDERFNTYVETQKYEVHNISEVIERTDTTSLDLLYNGN